MIKCQFVETEVDRRASVARELLRSEESYLQTLDVIHNTFYSPCEAALMSNRAIISAQNVKLLFTDVLQLRTVSRSAQFTEFSSFQFSK